MAIQDYRTYILQEWKRLPDRPRQTSDGKNAALLLAKAAAAFADEAKFRLIGTVEMYAEKVYSVGVMVGNVMKRNPRN